MPLSDSHEQIPTWWWQPNFRAFRDAISGDQSLLLFVGSGLSVGAGLPNWPDLLLKLAGLYDEKYSDIVPHRCLLDEVRAMLTANRLPAQKHKEAGSRIEHAYIEKGQGTMQAALGSILRHVQPTKAHEAIARMRWSKIITTNYDTLLEDAARAKAASDAARAALSEEEAQTLLRSIVVTSPIRENFRDSQLQGGSRYVVKIHGDISDHDSHIVLSAESFKELYNGKYKDVYAHVMATLLSSSPVLFLGYSHDDEDVQQLFTEVMKHAAHGKVYAVVAREGKPREFAERVAARPANIQFITYSPDDHHSELRELLEYFSDPTREELYQRLRTRRRPSVVMLHCGGTIGARPAERRAEADNPHLEVQRKESRFDAELESSIEQLDRWYTEAYVAGDDIPTDLIWEVLPIDGQMFSENATPELWNTLREKIEDIIFKYFFAEAALETPSAFAPDGRLGRLYEEEDRQWRFVHGDGQDLTEKRFEADFTQRYVLGIVVRFGTDSLAYAASAMALGIQHLPCPVIITGANQPPSEDTGLLAERAPRYAESDTWANLMTSLFFLQCFGHTVTEVLVSFGSTIHNGINLRKRATEIIPAGRDAGPRHSEPFSFRNLSQRGQYMFKLIDGVFCDNFYPNAVWSSFSCYNDLLNRKNDLRHLRFHAVDRTTPEESVGDQFSERVVYVEISPCFPRLDVRSMTKDGVYAALVEGYASGTFPSEGKHAFVQFLRDAYKNGLPVVLVSRYGTLATQQAYAVGEEFTGRSPVLPLFEIIAETALPLLALVTAKIDPDVWRRRMGERKGRLIERRIEALRSGIEAVFEQRRNILSEELKHVSNRDALLEARKKNGSGSSRQNAHLHVGPNVNFLATDALKMVLSERLFGAEGIAVVSRHDLVAILAEFPRLFSRFQAGPDGLEQVSNIGYEVGGALWRSSWEWYDEHTNASAIENEFQSKDYFFRQKEPAVQDARVNSANAILAKVGTIVDVAGVTKAPIAAVTLKRPQPQGPKAGSFVLTVSFPHAEYGDQNERSYAVRTMTDLEQEFLRTLRGGCKADTDVATYLERLRLAHDDLLRATWLQLTTTADWFLLGIYKGIACRLAEFLVIDNEAALASQSRGAEKPMQSLRRRVKTRIIPSQPERLKVTYEYVEAPDEGAT